MTDLLETTLCGIPLRNPVLAASGTFGYGLEFAKLVDLNQLGGIITKGLSREPIAGNPAPRLWHTEGGMINSVGLQNVGVSAFIRDKLPKLRTYTVPVIANVFGYAIEDYLAVIEQLENAEGIAAYELNVSCPNTKEGGIFFSSDPALLADLVGRVRLLAKRPLIVKLSPNVARIAPFARTAEEAGADAISLINTFVSLAIDVQTRSSRIGAVRRSNRDADGCLLAGGVGASASADGFRLRVVRRSSVLFVALQSALLLRERMDARRMGAAILVFIGIVLIWLA